MTIGFQIFFRKISSLIIRSKIRVSTLLIYNFALANGRIEVAKDCSFGRDFSIRATDGASIKIGARCTFGDQVEIVAQGGVITIGEDVHIGKGSVIVCRESISIGSDTLIAEYVVIRDQNHETKTRPIKSAGFRTSPISIGEDVWIGCKASILQGGSVGNRSIVGAHALVLTSIASDQLAVGIPARQKSNIGNVF